MIFKREELLIGKEGLEKLKNSKVAVFGIGGVGSFTAEALARAGIGSLVLIDNDNISITNINRQIHALKSTLYRPKTEVMRERLLDINENINVTCFTEFYLPGSAEKMISPDYSYIVDAVDTVTAKIDLVINAQKRNIPIISSMGTGNKLDPTKFLIDDIYNTSVCPLARVMRQELKKRNVASLNVLYSKETPINIEPVQEEGVNKRSVPGSISFVPSAAGLIIASRVVNDILFSKNK